jgi:energy-coupling factor transport system ATP-binding protein
MWCFDGGDFMNAVTLKNVSFAYDDKHLVLDKINFAASYHQVVLVAGYSGGGKSTLMGIISGIIPNITKGKLSGEVFIDDENINNQKMSSICRKVGVVLQNADEQIINKIVEDEIAFGCENMAFSREKIKEQINAVCSLMHLDKSWNTRSLSGGQKQRLITASILAMGQKIIILDEPLANLDKEGSLLLMKTLKTLAANGYCIIIVEHRLDMVLPYVDQVYHIGDTQVIKIDNKEEYLKAQTKLIKDTNEVYYGTNPLITLSNVSYRVGNREILKDITFNINQGERVVILGENGCGKTTLLRIIGRLNKPSKGSVYQNIDSSFKQNHKGNKKWFKKVGIVYQNPDYQLFMPSVQQEIEFGALSKEYAQRMIKLFSLEDLVLSHPQSLSEGQKRRVSIAAVLASKPELLLLDEPTVGQDYQGLCDLADILNTIHQETHNTIITITHDFRFVLALCDKSIIIEDGRVKNIGSKDLAQSYFTNL